MTGNLSESRPSDVSNAAVSRAEAWERALGEMPDHRTAPHDLILGRGGDSVEFTQRLLDLLFGGDDAFTAADGLREMSREVPDSLSPRDRLAVRAGGAASLSLPWAVMPLAKRWLRDRVAHLVLVTRLPVRPAQLDRRSRSLLTSGLTGAIRKREADGGSVALELLGDPVLGPAGAEAELDRLCALASLDEVTRVIVDPARLSPGGNDWSAAADTAQAATMLQALLEVCLEHDTAVSLEAHSYRWAQLATEVLIRATADARFDAVRVGIALPAELPESADAAKRLMRWAAVRRRDGGAPVDIVIGDAGIAASERVASIHSGLPVPTLDTREEIDAQLVRLAHLTLRSPGVHTVVASESPRVLAAVTALAQEVQTPAEEKAAPGYTVRLRTGVAPELASVLRDAQIDVHEQLPVTVPDELTGIVERLVALAAEAAERLSVGANEEPVSAEIERLLALAEDPFPESHRTQSRAREWNPSERDSALFYRPPDEAAEFHTAGLTAAVLGLSRSDTGEIVLEDFAPVRPIPVVSASGFANEPLTDASRAENRAWAVALVEQAANEGENATIEIDREALRQLRQGEPVDLASLSAEEPLPEVGALLREAGDAQARWGAQPPKTRALRLRRAALGAAAARDRLTQELTAATGAPLAEIDLQISEIIDAARYHGQLAEELAAVRGAEFLPGGLTLIAAAADVTLAEQAEQVLAGLGAGCAALWAVPIALSRAAKVLVEEWEAAGLTEGAVKLIPSPHRTADAVTSKAVSSGADPSDLPEAEGTSVADAPEPWVLRLVHGVDRVAVLGDRDLADRMRRRRPDARIEGRFFTTGTMIVTPAAPSDDAVRDLVRSAFTGPRSRRVQAAILVGRTGRSQRLRERLVDAASALRVGDARTAEGAEALDIEIGPLSARATAAGMRALTELDRGEEWVLEPRRLDEAGLVWSPGIRLGVSANSSFWEDAQGLPLIGILRARSIAEAIKLQNQLGGGSHAVLHSLDAAEIGPWLEQSGAASLMLNRASSPVRIERQPVGGWGSAVMGMPALAGGPNRLITQGSWRVRPGTRSSTLHLKGLDPEVQVLIEASQEVLDYEQFDELRRAALADALAWRTKYGLFEDTIGLGVERNVVRYWPVPTQVRLAEGGSLAQLLRVVAAALIVRARITVSTGEVLPPPVATFLATQGIAISLERDDDWLERLAVSGATDGRDLVLDRVRLIGGDRVRVAEWMSGRSQLTLWAEPVTMAGPVELFSLLREQSISASAVRHGIAMTVPELDERLG